MSHPTAIELLYPDREYIGCNESDNLRETSSFTSLDSIRVSPVVCDGIEFWHDVFDLPNGEFLHDLNTVDNSDACIHWVSSTGNELFDKIDKALEDIDNGILPNDGIPADEAIRRVRDAANTDTEKDAKS